MQRELEIAIEELYKIFAIYPLASTVEGCPCCVSNSDKEKIHSKQLKELEEEDLSRYAFKAMTTWGNVEDFKHYLPRIFELLSTTDFIVDKFVVLGKLEYGKWKTWDEKEQEIIKEFLVAWWNDLVTRESYFNKEVFVEINKLIDDIDQLLKGWALDFKNNSFATYVDLVHDYYIDLIEKRKKLKDIGEQDADTLLKWIQYNSQKLETGFFHFDEIDKEMAEKISNTQYIYEHSQYK